MNTRQDRLLRTRTAHISIHDAEWTESLCVGSGRVWTMAIQYLDGKPLPEEFGCLHVPRILVDIGLTMTASRDSTDLARRMGLLAISCNKTPFFMVFRYILWWTGAAGIAILLIITSVLRGFCYRI